ncbi:MAG: 7-carboxy-7-deazaguanine synthase QueE [Candidatus Hatepunaea meridiana]|nr:7-carboxy-7-deazaguanine synthase QueE [Candidatus Hatepunaea meridiana]
MPYKPNLTLIPENISGKLPVNELFYSIQGEGRWLGTPAVFIRFQYCNLGCAFCDSKYTWHQQLSSEATLHNPDDLSVQAASIVPQSIMKGNPPHVVLTGGEPMLHQNRIPALISELKTVGFEYFEIETNGTIIPDQDMLTAINWWNCSPKLSINLLSKEKYLNPYAIRTIAGSKKADFKFVIRNHKDFEEIEASYGKLISPHQIWLMPEGVNRDDQILSMREIADICIRKGYHFSPRLHILIWNNEKGY